jgi:hypothetical protein
VCGCERKKNELERREGRKERPQALGFAGGIEQILGWKGGTGEGGLRGEWNGRWITEWSHYVFLTSIHRLHYLSTSDSQCRSFRS